MSGIIGGAGSRSGVIGITELDYEEGIWSPGESTNDALQGSISSLVGFYVKIGKQIDLYVGITGTGMYFNSERGYLIITGTPFTAYMPTGLGTYAGSWTAFEPNEGNAGNMYMNAITMYLDCPGGNPNTSGTSNIGCNITIRIE